VRGIPTLLLFKNGELKETVVGLTSKDDLSRLIDKHLASGAADRQLA
jgi:thioredoxin-like negative regulator of GroEL